MRKWAGKRVLYGMVNLLLVFIMLMSAGGLTVLAQEEAKPSLMAAGTWTQRVVTSQDTYIQADNAGPFGGNATFTVKGLTTSAAYNRRALVRFDLSEEVIEAAGSIVLNLYVTGQDTSGSADRGLRIYDVGTDWDETTVKWNDITQSDASLPIVINEKTFTAAEVAEGKTATFDVTSYIKNAGKTNFGFMIVVNSSTNLSNSGIYFASKENAAEANRPALEMTYPLLAVEAETVEVSTPAGEYPALPETVSVTYNSGTTGSEAVIWDEIAPSQYAAAGTSFQVNGTVVGLTAVALVRVTAPLPTIVSIADIPPVTAGAGTILSALGLPNTVEVTLSGGETAQAPVTWSAGGYNHLAAGVYTIRGAIDATGGSFRNPDGLQPSVEVTLVLFPDKNILIYALNTAQKAVDEGTAANLVPSVRGELLAAIAAGREVNQNADATRAEIQESYQALQSALWKLSYQQADKAALTAALAKAAATDLAGKSAAKAQAVTDAVAAAQAVLDNQELSVGDQAAVDATTEKLMGALDALTANDGASSGPNTKPTTPAKPGTAVTELFSDVQADAWYIPAAQYVVDNGLMEGTDKGFEPNTNVSRAMMVTILHRVAGAPAQTGANKDIWYGEALAWGMDAGITDGTNPESIVTREQIAALLYRYAGAEAAEADLSAFSDADSISAWAKDAMDWAVANGLFTGKTGGVLDPQGSATRAEAAALLMRFAQLGEKGERGSH